MPDPTPEWTARALPSKLLLIDTPESVREAAQSLELTPINHESGDRSLLWHGRAVRLLREPPATSPLMSVVVPLDALVDVRIAALRQLVAMLRGTSPGPDPLALNPHRRRKLIHTLRALDGRLDGASYRQIAAALFGSAALPSRGWKTHDLRDRTIRLVRSGEAMMYGGYRKLLLYPYRGRAVTRGW